MSNTIPANSATSVIGSYDPETIRLAEIGSLVSSTVRFLVIVAAVKYWKARQYNTLVLLEQIALDLREGRTARWVTARRDCDFELVDLHITYVLDRAPTEAELDEGRCVFAMSGARGIDAWASEREKR